MKESKAKTILRELLSDDLRVILKTIFYFIFNKTKYRALKTYRFSDEELKYTHILEAVNYARVAGLPNVYFEFGCHSARTFSAAARSAALLEMNDTEFYAFDSFEGLPETSKEEDGIFETGEFNTSIELFKKIVSRKGGLHVKDEHIITGFYENSLTSELQSRLPHVGIVHIDVDLYSSTIEVLNFLKPLLVEGSVILFDDWYCFPPSKDMGEKKALNEFCNENKEFEFESWKAYSTFGKSFFVTKVPSDSS